MRDLVAAFVAVALVVVALSMATSLHRYRQTHARLRRQLRAQGQRIVAEIPGGDDLKFFTEDVTAFHWADRPIPKDKITAARLLISGAPISVRVSNRFSGSREPQPVNVDDHPDAFERDRWDVAIELDAGTVLVACGTIRERVSQELARRVFDAVTRDIEAREGA